MDVKLFLDGSREASLDPLADRVLERERNYPTDDRERSPNAPDDIQQIGGGIYELGGSHRRILRQGV